MDIVAWRCRIGRQFGVALIDTANTHRVLPPLCLEYIISFLMILCLFPYDTDVSE